MKEPLSKVRTRVSLSNQRKLLIQEPEEIIFELIQTASRMDGTGFIVLNEVIYMGETRVITINVQHIISFAKSIDVKIPGIG